MLAELIPDLIAVEQAEAERFACNAVVVGRTVVTNTGSSGLHAQLRARGFTAAGNAAGRIRQSGRQRQMPDAAARRRRSGRLEAMSRRGRPTMPASGRAATSA